MPYQIEVCIDNIESLHNAVTGGATRIELCSSLALGGLTPSYGLMKKAAETSTVPVYAMIRPRQGDFLYSSDDIEIMLEDIYLAKQAGLQGVVFGVLSRYGEIDMEACAELMRASRGMGVTFHRAIDQCTEFRQAIEDISDLGCERVLTSGLAATAFEGLDTISEMVKLSAGRFSVMAGAGVSSDNAVQIIRKTGVKEVHLSGKTNRASKMKMVSDSAKMGKSDLDDYLIPVTDTAKIRAVTSKLLT